MGKFLVMETFFGLENAQIVIEENTGLNKVFATEAEALVEAEDCQDGFVVSIEDEDEDENSKG